MRRCWMGFTLTWARSGETGLTLGFSGERGLGMLRGVGIRLKLKVLEFDVPGRAEDGRLASIIESVELRPIGSRR